MTETLWKIDATVTGKQLPRALSGLVGAIHLAPPRPVVNAKVGTSRIKAVAEGATVFDRVVVSLPKGKTDKATLGQIIQAQGGSESYVQGLINKLIAEKHLKRIGKGQYARR